MSQDIFARPYAKAVFLIAKEKNTFEKWWLFLKAAQKYSENVDVQSLFKNPLIPGAFQVETFSLLLKESMFDEARQFLIVLAKKKRLIHLSDIASLFEKMMNAEMKKMNVKVTSAFEVGTEEIQKLKTLLGKKYNAEINVECEINPQVLGGMIIRANDEVLDGSVKGRLKNLTEALLNESKR